jgi:hypothetical protein
MYKFFCLPSIKILIHVTYVVDTFALLWEKQNQTTQKWSNSYTLGKFVKKLLLFWAPKDPSRRRSIDLSILLAEIAIPFVKMVFSCSSQKDAARSVYGSDLSN